MRQAESHAMATLRDMLDLELALLRRGLDERLAGSERCTCCHRTPLVGERVYVYGSGTIACELCRDRQREARWRAAPSTGRSSATRCGSSISAPPPDAASRRRTALNDR